MRCHYCWGALLKHGTITNQKKQQVILNFYQKASEQGLARKTLEFLFRQELYARKQGPTEPLSMYTEDIIKKSQRLALSDKDLMNVFINGLFDEIKNHVILNQQNSLPKLKILPV